MTYLEKSVTKEGLQQAFGVIEDSVQHRIKKLLVVAHEDAALARIRTAVAAADLEIVVAHTSGEALSIVTQQYLDGILIDNALADISAPHFIEEVQRQVKPYTPPIVVFSLTGLADHEAAELRRLSRSSVVRLAVTPERLLDETVLLLHRRETDLTASQCSILGVQRETDSVLAGRKVLVVDDDLRNIFALSSFAPGA